jgi:hypothetical protein
MWSKVLYSSYSEELEEHPEGADRGGHINIIQSEAEVITSHGKFCYEYGYTDHYNYTSDEGGSLSFWRNDKEYDLDTGEVDDPSCPGACLADAAERIWEELKEKHPDIDQDFDRSVINGFLEFLQFKGLELKGDKKIRARIGDRLVKRKKIQEDKLEEFIFHSSSYYCWHRELAEVEEVQQAWKQIVAEVEAADDQELKDQVRSNKLEKLIRSLNNVFKNFGGIKVEDAIEATKACFVGRMMAS